MGGVGQLYCFNSPHARDFSEELDHSNGDLYDDDLYLIGVVCLFVTKHERSRSILVSNVGKQEESLGEPTEALLIMEDLESFNCNTVVISLCVHLGSPREAFFASLSHHSS